MDDCFIYVGPSISGGFLEGDCGCHSNCQNNLTELKSHGRVLNEVYKKLFREIDDKARSGADETLIMKDRVQLLEKYGKDLKEQNRLLLWTLEQTQQEMMESKVEYKT
ncbi:uncharacterized protein LOC134229327 [Saccostrea cucullata]|uniref:uncharacterized protein LOC134229327 n=1 Tax=Saccostrea cuccullata TaxID=36930 RepID=UPI002ED3C42E